MLAYFSGKGGTGGISLGMYVGHWFGVPLLLAPLSEVYGRVIVLQLANVVRLSATSPESSI